MSPAPEVFHRVLADVLRDLPGVIHYVDDVLVYGNTAAEHDARLRAVLARITGAGFAVSDTKCVFKRSKVVFLGHEISGEAIRPDPAKVAALDAMRPPTNITEHRGLMGFANFLAQYVPHYSTITEPLRRLQSGRALFRWTSDQQKAFECLKAAFREDPCLVPYDERLPLTVATDASATGLGAVLLQNNRPVMYLSRALTPAETRYSTIEKELLAVVFAMQRAHFYTFGRTVRILTDHRSLLGLVVADLDKVSPRLRRFLERLFPYDLRWEYIPGKDNVIPDYLSRMAPQPPVPVEAVDAEHLARGDSPLVSLLFGGGPFYEELAAASREAPLFQYLREKIQTGWPQRAPQAPAGIQAYWGVRERAPGRGWNA